MKLLITIVFAVAISHWQQTSAEEGCDNPTELEFFKRLPGKWKGAYAIGTQSARKSFFGTTSSISCLQFINVRTGDNTIVADRFGFVADGVERQKNAQKIRGGDGKLTFKVLDNPPVSVKFNVVQRSNGVYIGYFCPPPDYEQVAVIAYKPEEQGDLDKEAEEVAKTLTSSPNDFKVDHNSCKPLQE